MHPLLKTAFSARTRTSTFYSNLIGHCVSLKSLEFGKAIHAQLIKVGLKSFTILGNRCAALYSQFGAVNDVLRAFDETVCKSRVSWTICLNALLKSGQLKDARQLFDEMPEKDVVSWTSMVSGCASGGSVDLALELFYQMQCAGVRADELAFKVLFSIVSSLHYAKQIHAQLIRNGVFLSNVKLGTSLMDLYGKVWRVDYATGVFWMMTERDSISWSALILICHKSGHAELSLRLLHSMRSAGHSPDHYTLSTALAACSNLRDLGKGKTILVLCIKLGLFPNTLVCSAGIDLFSKCNHLADSVQLFSEIHKWDSAACNSMIASYEWHGLAEEALRLFVSMLKRNVRPTEFTFSSVINSASCLFPMEHGFQIHSLTLRSGVESDTIVTHSLMKMYAKFGVTEPMVRIFMEMDLKTPATWTALITGLACHGGVMEALHSFRQMLEAGSVADTGTLSGVLRACCYGGFVDEGMALLSSMEESYGVKPMNEHYAWAIEMMSRAGKTEEAMKLIEKKTCETSALVLRLLIRNCRIHGDWVTTNRAAERLVQMEPQSSLPFEALAWAYEMEAKWESAVRVRRAMQEMGVSRVVGGSWIGVRNHVVAFMENQMVHHQGKALHSILNLLMGEMKDEGSAYAAADDEMGFEAEEA